MVGASNGVDRERPCPRCGRDGYSHDPFVPIEMMYSRSEVDVGDPAGVHKAMFTVTAVR